MTALSRAIRNFRIKQGLTQLQLGELVGSDTLAGAYSVQSVRKWEAGTAKPNKHAMEKLKKLARASKEA